MLEFLRSSVNSAVSRVQQTFFNNANPVGDFRAGPIPSGLLSSLPRASAALQNFSAGLLSSFGVGRPAAPPSPAPRLPMASASFLPPQMGGNGVPNLFARSAMQPMAGTAASSAPPPWLQNLSQQATFQSAALSRQASPYLNPPVLMPLMGRTVAPPFAQQSFSPFASGTGKTSMFSAPPSFGRTPAMGVQGSFVSPVMRHGTFGGQGLPETFSIMPLAQAVNNAFPPLMLPPSAAFSMPAAAEPMIATQENSFNASWMSLPEEVSINEAPQTPSRSWMSLPDEPIYSAASEKTATSSSSETPEGKQVTENKFKRTAAAEVFKKSTAEEDAVENNYDAIIAKFNNDFGKIKVVDVSQ